MQISSSGVTQVFGTEDHVLSVKPLSGASLLVLGSLVEFIDIWSMVYDSDYNLSLVIITCEMMKPNGREHVFSILRARWLFYNFQQKVVRVFPRSSRIRGANQGAAQFWNDPPLSTVPLLCPLPSCKSAQ